MVAKAFLLANILAVASASPMLNTRDVGDSLIARADAIQTGAAVTGAAAGGATAGGTAATNPDSYTLFLGDGTAKAGWPTKDKWINFDDMFTRNSAIMGKTCLDGTTPNTAAETASIKDEIKKVAAAAKVDPRFVLATIMQESNGCVRVKGTPSGEPGVFNPGLMQSFKGTGTCVTDNTKEINPCPVAQINQMITDGTQGTVQAGAAAGGLVQHLSSVGGDASGQTFYKAAREYNSGKVSPDGVLETAGAGKAVAFGVPCYSSDIANRLMGWASAPTKCNLK